MRDLCLDCLELECHSFRIHFWEMVLPADMLASGGRRELPGLQEKQRFGMGRLEKYGVEKENRVRSMTERVL